MATSRNSRVGKQPERKGSSNAWMPDPLRRSARVQNRVTGKRVQNSPSNPKEAPRVSHKDENRVQKKNKKKVSFDANQIEARDHHAGHLNPPLDRTQIAQAPTPAPFSLAAAQPAQGQPPRIRHVSLPPYIVEYPPDAASNILSPSRADRMQDLLAREHLDRPQTTAGKKRPIDNTFFGEVLNANPIKRRRSRITGLFQPLPRNPMVHLLSQLGLHPQMLTIDQISSILQIIQDRIFGSDDGTVRGFSESYFSFNLTPDQAAAWPLHELRTAYIPLYMTTRYLADGNQYGWHNFFTDPTSRQHLVSAILGEWFTQRIFKHTAFGFPKYLTEILEDRDREYLHYDAIVRSKERAKLMKAWYADFRVAGDVWQTTDVAAESLADELLTVLHPLLPPPIFDPLETSVPLTTNRGRRDSFTVRKEQQKQDLLDKIKDDLKSIILDCVALHQSIRLTGADGTIVRMAPNQQKGSQFHPTAPVSCVNPMQCNATVPDDPSEDSEICIKMTCWPRVEALVPEGPDMADLEFFEAQHRQEMLIQSTSGNNTQEFTWEGRDYHWPVVPPVLQDKEGLNAGQVNPETQQLNTIKRAAYVTMYQSLCPAKVYCEWTSQPAPKGQTLAEAVAEARRTHHNKLSLRLKDVQIEAWNFWALYGGVAQWGVLSGVAMAALYKYFHGSSYADSGLRDLVRGTGAWLSMKKGLKSVPGRNIPRQAARKLLNLFYKVSGGMSAIRLVNGALEYNAGSGSGNAGNDIGILESLSTDMSPNIANLIIASFLAAGPNPASASAIQSLIGQFLPFSGDTGMGTGSEALDASATDPWAAATTNPSDMGIEAYLNMLEDIVGLSRGTVGRSIGEEQTAGGDQDAERQRQTTPADHPVTTTES